MKPRNLLLVVLLLAAGAGVAFYLRRRAAAQSRAAESAQRAGPAQERPVPVAVAAVEQRDVPIYLEGLGNVAGFYTVAVRSQVDGRLVDVLFREGDMVRRGQVLAQIDPRPFRIQLHQAEAVRARDVAQLHANRVVLARDRVLRAGNLIAQQDLDTAAAAVETAAASVRADEAQIESARLNLDYARITAPIDGVTGIRQVDPGNLVRASDATGIVVIAQVDPIAVFFTLAQDELPRIAPEMARGPLRVEVFSRDGTTPLGTGTLALVDNQVNATTATIRLKAFVPNPERRLWPEQFVKVRMLLAVHRGALVVPAAAIQRGPQGTFVYVVGPDNHVATRNVTADQAEGELSLVTRGLRAGETVVTDGQNLLRPNALVAPRTAGAGGGDGGGGGGRRGGDGGTPRGEDGTPRGDGGAHGGHGWRHGDGGAWPDGGAGPAPGNDGRGMRDGAAAP